MLLSDNKTSDLPITLIKIASKPLSRFLCIVINHSFQTGTYPYKLKFAIVTPTHKGNCHLTLGNYRPISLLPVFSKIIEKLMDVRLMQFITKENILFDHQYGFQKNKTTSLAILDIYTKIVSSIENNDIACGIFLDFAKALDTVNHAILLKKMEHYGIRGLPLS